MSKQNQFMRSTDYRYCNNCQNGYQNDCPNHCNDRPPCCNDRDDCHDKDKNPCVVCPPGPEGPQGPAGDTSALSITPLAGGTRPVSAHLVITQIG